MSIEEDANLLIKLEKGGELTASALSRITNVPKIRVDKALERMASDGLVEKRRIVKTYQVSGTRWKQPKKLWKMTKKGQECLEIAKISYSMIEKAISGKLTLEELEEVKKHEKIDYIG